MKKYNFGQKIGMSMLLMASAASAGNFLWLIGVVAKPAADLLDARYGYSLAMGFSGLCILAVSSP